MSKTIYTDWTMATNNVGRAMAGFVSCCESGKNAWIEVRRNGNQAYPMKIKNPELDNPFNWTMSYGIPRTSEIMTEHDFFNETEKDLVKNWVACFGEQVAIKKYQEEGVISKELFNGSICHPVRIEDADRYRREIVGDNYEYGFWATMWKAIDDTPYWVVDKSVGEVYTVCYDDEPVDKVKAFRQAAEFMAACARKLERG